MRILIARWSCLPCALFAARVAFAHTIGTDGNPGLDPRWNFEGFVTVPLLISVALYAAGLAAICRRSRNARADYLRRATWFFSGWAMLVIALCSPLDGLSATLFSAHMVQHEVLMLLAAPLLVLGHPLAIWLWALPSRWRRAVSALLNGGGVRPAWRALTAPGCAWLCHAVTLWAWHMPSLFEAALHSSGMHVFQHASFLGGALLFWWSVLGRWRAPGQAGVATLSLFTTMVHTTLLGAFLTLSPALWYPSYAEVSAAAGFNPFEDQQLGGLIMWVPGGVAYVIGAIMVGLRLLFPEAAAPAVEAAPAGTQGRGV